jgi:hypothetical protein
MTGQELVDGEPSGTSVVVFPDGMLSAGNVHDEIYKQGGKTYAVKRVGRVELGSLSWTKGAGKRMVSNQFTANYNAKPVPQDIVANLRIARYTTVMGAVNFDAVDKVAALVTINANDIALYVGDSAYESSTADQFASAMSGVYIIFELATPVVYELDDFTLPEQFMVDALGTEEIIPVTGELAVAPILALRYGVNAVGTIQNLPKGYISDGSMDNFLSPLSSAMEGTWTKTWNDTTNKYEFSFTPNT